MQTDSRKIRSIIAKHFNTTIDDPVVIRCTDEIRMGKLGDPMDGMLALGMMPATLQREKEILDIIERGLHINIPRDSVTADVAKQLRIDGRSPEAWVAWYREDQFRLQSAPYMTIQKVWAMWPQAFVTAPTGQINNSEDIVV